MKSFTHGVEELGKLTDLSRQQWLLGAGVSVDSGIPLMYPLTARVASQLDGGNATIFTAVMGELIDNAHVEHVLSQLGDLIAIAERSKAKGAKVGANTVAINDLKSLYKAIIKEIAVAVRYGYRPAGGGNPEEIGTHVKPLVDVAEHRRFVGQLFKGRANLEGRSRISFITTNYDTLLEDALALERRTPLDGFEGGAIAFWSGLSVEPQGSEPPRSHKVLKLHGSVDWFGDPEAGLLRVRYGVKYLADLSATMIFPQATKYVETQRDPFARIFDCFRRSLSSNESHLLAIVGYSFGDSHINTEIESALSHQDNKTTLVAFSKEVDSALSGTSSPCETLERWRNDVKFGSRIYVATDKALYNGAFRIEPPAGTTLDWWKFSGVTNFLASGGAI